MMSQEELIKQAYDSVMQADEDLALDTIRIAKEQDMNLLVLLRKGFAHANKIIGDMFEIGDITLPELLFSAEVTRKAIEEVEKLEKGSSKRNKGSILIATVQGDVHEIGKGIVASTIISNGIEVIDLGREVPAEEIITVAEENNVDIIGTSALLTSTLKEQRKLEDLLRKKNIRDKYITIVGGGPCTDRWAKRIGADYYAEDAISASKLVTKLLEEKYKDE